MPEFLVRYKTVVVADNHKQAALLVLKAQRDITSTPLLFEVESTADVQTMLVDLTPGKECTPKEDLIHKVKCAFQEMLNDVETLVEKLDRSGSGVVDDHHKNSAHGKPFVIPRKVVLALLKEFDQRNQPPTFLLTKEFTRDVNNYYTLL